MVQAGVLLVVAGIWGLVAFCVAYKRARKNTATAGTGFRYNLCSLGILYLIPIGIATTFYVLLSLYISWFGDSLSIDRLIAMQQTFENVSTFFSDTLKLNELELFAVLVAVYLLTCVLLSKRRQVTALHRTVDVYARYSGPIAAGLATLASFSLFGMQLGEPTKDLRLRVVVAQQGYAEVTKKAEAELSQRVTSALHAEIMGAFPPAYREALSLPGEIDSRVASVQKHAYEARSTFDVSVPAVERTLRDERARVSKVNGLSTDLRIEGTGQRRMPGSVTYDQIEAARNAMDSRRDPKGIELVREGQKKVVLQVEKLAGERILAMTRPLTEAIPILEPLLQTLADAADKTLQDRIGKAYDRVMDAAMSSRRDLGMVIEHEVRTAVADTDIKALVADAVPRAEQQREKLERTLSELTASKPLIDRRVDKHLATREPRTPSEMMAELRHMRGRLDLMRMRSSYDLSRLHTLNRPPAVRGYPGPDRITPPRIVNPPKVARPATPRFFFW